MFFQHNRLWSSDSKIKIHDMTMRRHQEIHKMKWKFRFIAFILKEFLIACLFLPCRKFYGNFQALLHKRLSLLLSREKCCFCFEFQWKAKLWNRLWTFMNSFLLQTDWQTFSGEISVENFNNLNSFGIFVKTKAIVLRCFWWKLNKKLFWKAWNKIHQNVKVFQKLLLFLVLKAFRLPKNFTSSFLKFVLI